MIDVSLFTCTLSKSLAGKHFFPTLVEHLLCLLILPIIRLKIFSILYCLVSLKEELADTVFVLEVEWL